MADSVIETHWHFALGVDDLPPGGRKMVRVGGAQIALFHLMDGRILACDNRCPHEGYPLSEGNLGGESGCILTCNWHNWKFDLTSGETLVGGDRLRTYPTRVSGSDIEVEVVPPAPEAVIASALDGMVAGFERHEYDRFAREIARLAKAGGDPLQAVRRTIAETFDRFEYGASHALPATADWLSLRAEHVDDPVLGLAALTESVGHFAWDTQRHPRFPFTPTEAIWDANAFVAAVETEDEAEATTLVRGAITAGLDWPDMAPAFARAALAHYADFGHSAIYVYKMAALAGYLQDRNSLLQLALMLTRSLVYQSREDLIPEFRHYAAALSAWDGLGQQNVTSEQIRTGSVRTILDRMVTGSADPEALFQAAYDAAAWQMLHFDLTCQARTDGLLAQNIGWLDYTHGLTFANAARKLAEKDPSLWPAAILQIGCFLGRNAAFVDADLDVANWIADDPLGRVNQHLEQVADHGQGEYIVSCHLLKLTYAIREEIEDRPNADGHDRAVAALSRFLESPLKRRHTLRTARQAMNFIGV